MLNNGEKKSNKLLYILICLVIVAVLGGGIYFLLNNGKISKSIRNETITADNYEELMNKIGTEMKKDEDLYYLSYSTMYYIMQDGLASAFTNPDDETAMYKRIYGKTVQQLIDEGKQLMKDNNTTIEKFKKDLENFNKDL